MRAAVLCALACACASLSLSQQTGFTMAGVVKQHGSDQPLRRVEVSIQPSGQADPRLSMMTGNDGRFQFTNLAAGKYSLLARSHGLGQGYRGDDQYSTGIVVGPGIDSEHITFILSPPASISGTVIDEEGEPVRNAQVLLFQSGVFSGRRETVMQSETGTGSSGTFHFGSLKAGTYYVAVAARPWYAPNVPMQGSFNAPVQGSNASEFDVAYPVTYYPESLDAAGAAPITLSEGGVANLSMALRPVPAVHVTFNAPASEPIGVNFAVLGPGGAPIQMNNTTETAQNDRREILGLAPGRYVATVYHFGHRSTSTMGTKVVDLTGDATLDINDLPSTSISGQLQIEGGEKPGRLAVVLMNPARMGGGFGRVAEDGSFHIQRGNMPPGRYQIRLANTQEFYIRSVAVKGAEYSQGMLEVVDGASIQLSIVAAKGLSRVNGIAFKDDKPFAGAMVLLLPTDPSHAGDIPRDQSDSDGSFTLPSAAPGRYTLIAIDDGRDLAYQEPSVIKPYLANGQTVDVPLPRDAVVKVSVQPRAH